MAFPPTDPWHRRYWRTTNRPYTGCGCLYAILIILIIWWLLGLALPGPHWWR